MNILALSPWFPYPPDNGSKLRIFNLLKQLSRKHRITLLAMTAEDEGGQQNVTALRRWCQDVKTVLKRTYRPRSPATWLGFFSFWPRHHIQTFSPEMQDLVTSEIQAGGVDLCVAFEFGTMRYLAGYKHVARVFEGAELIKMREGVTRQANPLLMLRHRLPWWKTRWLVKWVSREFDLCTVASEQERRVFQQLVPGYKSIAVIPNGVEVGHYTGDFGQPQEDSLIFSGALTYSVNYGAIKFFLKDTFSLIKKERPGVVLRITGKTAGVPLEQLPNVDGVIFTGYLDDVRPSIARSWVSVAPLCVGGGTRLKILEAMALGTPVVSTSKGAEGLDVTPGKHILIADTPAEFADAVLCLLRSPGLRARLSENGRGLIQKHYDWLQIGEKFEHLLRDVVEGRE